MNIYILLTRSKTIVSKVVYLTTKAQYTHASIAYDERLETLCSFTRKQPNSMLPAGLAFESIYNGYFSTHSNIPCILLSLSVSDKVFEDIKSKLGEMFSHKDDYHYSVLGLVRCKMGIKSRKGNKYFCSQFVAEILESSGAISLPKEPSLMHPCDFLEIKEFSCEYKGKLTDLIKILKEK